MFEADTCAAIDEDQPDLVLITDDYSCAAANQLETTANKWLKPYPNAVWRENIEVFLVAIVIAMGIRTFFVQPFKIPTGSMQPTLFGNTMEDMLKPLPTIQISKYRVLVVASPMRCCADNFIMSGLLTLMVKSSESARRNTSACSSTSRTGYVQYAGQPQPTVKTFWFTPEDVGSGRDPFTMDEHRARYIIFRPNVQKRRTNRAFGRYNR